VKPAGFDPKRKYPLILDIHGGPQSMYNVAFSFARQNHAPTATSCCTPIRAAARVRREVHQRIKNAYPGKDFDDLMTGVDTVLGRGYIDAKKYVRLWLLGRRCADAWTVGHTDRFAAAASLCPVIDG